jgi:hypothetical protein
VVHFFENFFSVPAFSGKFAAPAGFSAAGDHQTESASFVLSKSFFV